MKPLPHSPHTRALLAALRQTRFGPDEEEADAHVAILILHEQIGAQEKYIDSLEDTLEAAQQCIFAADRYIDFLRRTLYGDSAS